jgi:hypothetical protein
MKRLGGTAISFSGQDGIEWKEGLLEWVSIYTTIPYYLSMPPL